METKQNSAGDSQQKTTKHDAEIRALMEDLLILIADKHQGCMAEKDMNGWASNGPEIIQSLGEHGFITLNGQQFVLTTIGWQNVCAISSARSLILLQRKDDELSAHKKYHEKEQAILREINRAEAAVEARKGALNAAKENLVAAHEALAALVAGGVQTDFIEADKGKKTDDELQSEWAKILPPVPPESVRVFPIKGCPQQDDVKNSLVLPETMAQEKRKVEALVQGFGVLWIVNALWTEEATGSTRANLLPAMTKDEWQQLHEADYGRAVDGFDQSDDARDVRQKGGPWCGLAVRHGRQVFVVGPQSSAVHVVHVVSPEK